MKGTRSQNRRAPTAILYIGSVITFIGWFIVGKFAMDIIPYGGTFNMLAKYFLNGACTGAALGISQWWVLRQYISRASIWILSTSIGFALGLCLAFLLGNVLGGIYSLIDSGRCFNPTLICIFTGSLAGIFSGTVAAAVLGYLQHHILRKYIAKSVRWRLITIVSMGLTMGLLTNMMGDAAWSIAIAVVGSVQAYLLNSTLLRQNS